MALTVREKEEWERMLSSRIDAAITALWGANPKLRASLKAKARSNAEVALGVVKDLAEVNKLYAKAEAAKAVHVAAKDALLRKLGVGGGTYNRYGRIDNAIESQADAEEEALMGTFHPATAEVKRLTEEKARLKETVWLATSSKEIKDFWASFTESMGDTPTPAQASLLEG